MSSLSTPPRGAVAPAILLILTLAGFAAAADRTTVDGVLHVRNGATPSQGTETIALEELWRVGGDDEEVFFGLVAQVLTDDADNAYLLDSQLSQVEVFDLEGHHTGTLGRQGEGPGEFNAAFDMVFMPDGTLGVSQSFPGKIVKLNLDGTPAGVFQPTLHESTAGGFLALVNCLSGGGNLVLAGLDISFDQATFTQDRRNFVASFDAEGKVVTEYVSVAKTWELRDFTLTEELQDAVWGRLDVGADGKVYCGIPRDRYEITVFAPDGRVEHVIERDYEPWRRNERALARMTAQMEGVMRQLPPGADYEVDAQSAALAGLTAREDGSLWVMNSRAMFTAGPGDYTYDVFDREGEFVRQVTLHADGRADEDALIFAGEGRAFRITGFWDALTSVLGGAGSGSEEDEESAPMEVICYRIP